MHRETFSPIEGYATAANRKAVKSNRDMRWLVRAPWLSTIPISHPLARATAKLFTTRKYQLSCRTMNGPSFCLGLVCLVVPACAQTAVLSQEVESVDAGVSAFTLISTRIRNCLLTRQKPRLSSQRICAETRGPLESALGKDNGVTEEPILPSGDVSKFDERRREQREGHFRPITRRGLRPI
jgi:hypothetical protein